MKYLICALFLILLSFSVSALEVSNYVELISNTDQCLGRCEAVLRYKNPLPAQICLNNPALYRFDFVNSENLINYWIEEEVITDVNIETPVYEYDAGIRYLGEDNNFPSNSLWEDFNNPILLGYIGEIVEKKEWNKINLDEICINAFSFKNIKLVGNKRIALGENTSVDWIPTIAGIQITEWDWWDTDYNLSIPIIRDLNDYSTASLDANWLTEIWVNTQAWVNDGNCQADGDDIRIVCDSNITGDAFEIDFNMWGFGDTNTQFLFLYPLAQPDFVDIDQNCSFYMGNAEANAPTTTLTLETVETVMEAQAGVVFWEDFHELDDWFGNCYAGGTFDTIEIVADRWLHVSDAGVGNICHGTITIPASKFVFESRFKSDGSTMLNNHGIYEVGGQTGGGVENYVQLQRDTSTQLRIRHDSGSGSKITQDFFIWDVDKWVTARIIINEVGLADMNAVDTDGILSYSTAIKVPSLSDLNQFFIGQGAGAGESLYYDYIRAYNDDYNYTVSLGAAVTFEILTFSDINLFQYDSDYSHNVDLNIDADLNILWDINVTGADQNMDSLRIYYHSVEIEDENCYGVIRNDLQCGWKEELANRDIFWTLINQTGDTNHYRSDSEDDHAFKLWTYNLDPELFESRDSSITLDSANDWAKILLTHSDVDTNVFYNFSFHANYTGTTNRNLEIFDCNFDVINPVDNNSCNVYTFTNVTEMDADGYYSIKVISNDLNQIVGDKNVLFENTDGNHWYYLNCPQCNAAKYWSIDTLTQNSNIDRTRNWTSTTGVAGLAADNTQSIDAHLHWIDLEETNYFDFIIQIGVLDGSDFNSEMQRYPVLETNLPPIINQIQHPNVETYYSGTIDVNISVSDPNDNNIVCDINLLDSSFIPVAIIAFQIEPIVQEGASLVCTIDFNTLDYADGNYYIAARVREVDTGELYFSDLNMDVSFAIDNTKPSTSHNYNFNCQQSPIIINLTCHDNNACAYIAYREDSGDWNISTDNPFPIVLTTSSDKNISLDFNSTDAAGNIGDINSIQVCITALPPPPAPLEKPMQRFFSAIDQRLLDTNRYYSQLDVRGKKVEIESGGTDRFIFQNLTDSAQPIILYLSIAVILLVSLIAFIEWRRRR